MRGIDYSQRKNSSIKFIPRHLYQTGWAGIGIGVRWHTLKFLQHFGNQFVLKTNDSLNISKGLKIRLRLFNYTILMTYPWKKSQNSLIIKIRFNWPGVLISYTFFIATCWACPKSVMKWGENLHFYWSNADILTKMKSKHKTGTGDHQLLMHLTNTRYLSDYKGSLIKKNFQWLETYTIYGNI